MRFGFFVDDADGLVTFKKDSVQPHGSAHGRYSMQTRRLTPRGRHSVLPIVGDTLVEVRLSTCNLPALVLEAADRTEAGMSWATASLLGRSRQRSGPSLALQRLL